MHDTSSLTNDKCVLDDGIITTVANCGIKFL